MAQSPNEEPTLNVAQAEMAGSLTKVFLLDDHDVVRAGVKEMLEATGEFKVVGESAAAVGTVERVGGCDPDVAVLDVRLPDGNGVEVCRDIKARYPNVGCLMLTTFSDDEALFDAIMAGAAGYVLKQISGSDLVHGVRTVAAGGSLLDPTATARVLDRIRNGSGDDGRVASLTEQERRIFDLIGEGKTNRQIATEMFLAEKTVKNYVSNVLSKMGMQRRTEVAAHAARRDERKRRMSSEG